MGATLLLPDIFSFIPFSRSNIISLEILGNGSATATFANGGLITFPLSAIQDAIILKALSIVPY